MRTLPFALAALLVALAAPSSQAAAPEGLASSWREMLHVDSSDSGTRKPFEAFDAASLNLFDFDGDARLEIVTSNDNNRVYVLDAGTGVVLAEIETTHPGGDAWEARDINPTTITDLLGDGTPCLVIPNSAAYLSAWCYEGRRLLGGLAFAKRWEIRVDAALHEEDFGTRHPWITAETQPGLDGNAYASDVTGDGVPEIFVETDGYPGQLSYDSAGRYRWSRSWYDGNAGAQVADLDRDGRKEVVFASDAGVIAVYDARDGAQRWTFDAAKEGVKPGSIPVGPLLADLNGDGDVEMVFAARSAVQSSDPQWRDRSHATWFALGPTGKVLWRASYDWMNPMAYNRPAAIDIDGDRVKDIVALDWNTIGHKPGNWEPTSRPANLFVLSGRDGAPLWHRGVDVYWSNKDFVVVDLPGAPGPEIVLNAAKHGIDGLGIYALRDGKERGWFPLDGGWEVMRGPVAGDLLGDGRVRLVVPVAKPNPEPNYRVLDVGHRVGALKIVDIGEADIVFSANVMHTDALPRGERNLLSGVLGIPTLPLVGVLVALAAVALARRR